NNEREGVPWRRSRSCQVGTRRPPVDPILARFQQLEEGTTGSHLSKSPPRPSSGSTVIDVGVGHEGHAPCNPNATCNPRSTTSTISTSSTPSLISPMSSISTPTSASGGPLVTDCNFFQGCVLLTPKQAEMIVRSGGVALPWDQYCGQHPSSPSHTQEYAHDPTCCSTSPLAQEQEGGVRPHQPLQRLQFHAGSPVGAVPDSSTPSNS
ncbi:unnamed protein product, partial [Amoebophrya sp. A25]